MVVSLIFLQWQLSRSHGLYSRRKQVFLSGGFWQNILHP